MSRRVGAKRGIADFMLACYSEATGCSKSSLIADALIDRINHELARNAGTRKRYEEARRRLIAQNAGSGVRELRTTDRPRALSLVPAASKP